VENDLYESRFFNMGFRAISNDPRSVKIFSNGNSFEFRAQMTFDAEHEGVTGVEYFLGSIVGSILLSLLELAQRKHIRIEEMEGRLGAKLENPLSLLHVRGYDREPAVGSIAVTVYLYADMEEGALLRFCDEALTRCPVYNFMKKTDSIAVSFKVLP
jgi:uncharacterized OsmC-like protein